MLLKQLNLIILIQLIPKCPLIQVKYSISIIAKNISLIFIYLKVINKWVAMGREIWELIEPIDGFHMNQDANALLADEIWSLLETKYPSWIGNINPFNDEIIKIFGDQNGY